MTVKRTRAILIALIAVLMTMILCTVISDAATKKYYQMISNIDMPYVNKNVSYKGNTLTLKSGDEKEKYVFKGEEKTKNGKVFTVSGNNGTDKEKIKFYYNKKGKLYRYLSTTTYASDELKSSTFDYDVKKTDKYGNIKSMTGKLIMKYSDGTITSSAFKVKCKNTYQNKRIKKCVIKNYTETNGKWYSDDDVKYTYKYKKVKLTKKQYKRFNAIMQYIRTCY